MNKVIIALLLSTTVRAQDLPDSLLTIDYIYNYTFTDFDKSVHIADQMRRRAMEAPFRLDMAEGDLYFNNGKHHQALKFYNRAMESDSVRLDDGLTMKMLHRFISVYDRLHNNVKLTQTIEQLLEKSRAAGDPVMESIAQFNLGKMIIYQQDKERGYRLMREAIRLMEESEYEYKNDNLVYDYNTLYVMLNRDQKHKEALAVLDKLATVIAGATDEHYNMEGINRKELKALYAHRAYTLSKLGHTQEAAQWYTRWKEMGNINRKDNYLIISYLMTVGRYNEVIAVNREQEDFLRSQNDTVNYHMVTVKRTNGRAYEAMKDFRQAARSFDELAILTDSLKIREQKSAALELATVYEMMEKEAEIQQQHSDLRMRNVLLGSAVVAILLLEVIIWRGARSARIIRRKNAALAKEMDKLVRYKSHPSSPTGDENKALFVKLNEQVISNQLYLNRSISREELMKLVGVDKNRFGQLMKQETGVTLTVYLNNLRLEHAVQLMNENPGMGINRIAELSAMPNSSTFYRLFKERYEMTPVEYLEARKTLI